MRRSLISTIIILLLFCATVFAIPSEGDFLPAEHKSVWGMQFNHIFGRDFNKVEGKGTTTQYFIAASYGLTKRFFLDGKVGMGSVGFDRNDGINLDFPGGFAGGYGFRYVLFEDEGLNVKSIAGFQHISCHPHKDTIASDEHRVIWDEWQGTWLFIKEWHKSALYGGLQYSETQLKYKVDTLRWRLKSEDKWGILVGTNYRFTPNMSINIEGRLFDEKGLNCGVYYKF